jgi:hypothetical protein
MDLSQFESLALLALFAILEFLEFLFAICVFFFPEALCPHRSWPCQTPGPERQQSALDTKVAARQKRLAHVWQQYNDAILT